MKFSVGDIVRIRSWDDMKAEFGEGPTHDCVAAPFSFIRGMRKYCGREICIDRLEKDDVYSTVEVFSHDLPGVWHWSEEMFEYTTPPVVVSDVQNLQDFL